MGQIFDTSVTGNPVTGPGQVHDFGAPTKFYLTLASYIIQGQGSGPSVTFTIYGGKDSGKLITVNYGDVIQPIELNGTTIAAASVNGPGAVSVRVIASGKAQQLSPTVVGTATSSGAQVIFSTVSYTSPGLKSVATCPPNFKWTIIRIYVTPTGNANLILLITPNPASSFADYLANALAITSEGAYFGMGPANTVVWSGNLRMIAGDQMLMALSANNAVFGMEVLQEPL